MYYEYIRALMDGRSMSIRDEQVEAILEFADQNGLTVSQWFDEQLLVHQTLPVLHEMIGRMTIHNLSSVIV